MLEHVMNWQCAATHQERQHAPIADGGKVLRCLLQLRLNLVLELGQLQS